MSHPRSSCEHASVGLKPSQIVCGIAAAPAYSHVGVCVACPKHSKRGEALPGSIQINANRQAVRNAPCCDRPKNPQPTAGNL